MERWNNPIVRIDPDGGAGAGWLKLHPRITARLFPGAPNSQIDIGYRAATWLRGDILRYRQIDVRNWRTIYINFNTGTQNWSAMINPWKNWIYHEAPGIISK